MHGIARYKAVYFLGNTCVYASLLSQPSERLDGKSYKRKQMRISSLKLRKIIGIFLGRYSKAPGKQSESRCKTRIMLSRRRTQSQPIKNSPLAITDSLCQRIEDGYFPFLGKALPRFFKTEMQTDRRKLPCDGQLSDKIRRGDPQAPSALPSAPRERGRRPERRSP